MQQDSMASKYALLLPQLAGENINERRALHLLSPHRIGEMNVDGVIVRYMKILHENINEHI
jgi:hypothetical protein